MFLYCGKPVKWIQIAVKTPCRKAGIVYGRLKKERLCVSRPSAHIQYKHAQACIPESVIMAVLGHNTREIFDRYNTVDLDDTRKAVDQLQIYLVKISQTLAKKGNDSD